MCQVSDYPWGPWDGDWPTKEAFDANEPEVAYFPDGKEDFGGDWFVKHPDGRVQRRSFGGDPLGFLTREEIDRMRQQLRRRR